MVPTEYNTQFMTQTPLSRETLHKGVRALARRDPDLARIVRDHGAPPLWARPAGFPTLVHIILEQQVSLASARSAYLRLRESTRPLTPANFLTHGDAALKRFGFSRQKTRYCRELASAILERRLVLRDLPAMNDADVHGALTQVKGIGDWTADIYLLMVLRRPDIWPRGDLALVTSLCEAKRLRKPPTPERFHALAEGWRPWRAVAARMLWHRYLCLRRK